MRLFGEQGYTSTSVAEIENAAGLRPGAGGLYAHYRSKEDLLRAGLKALLTPDSNLMPTNPAPRPDGQVPHDLVTPVSGEESAIDEHPDSDSPDSNLLRATQQEAADTSAVRYEALVSELEDVVRAGMDRLQHDRDFNRVLVRDLRGLPDLLTMSADQEIRPLHDQLEAYLTSSRFQLPDDTHPRAMAAVLIGSTAHFWLLSDIFGEHPAGVSQTQFISALARLTASLITPRPDS